MGTDKTAIADEPDNNGPDGPGAEWRRPPPGWVKPQPGSQAPDLSGATQEMFDEAIRSQLAPNESFWRAFAREEAKPALAVERMESARALTKTMLSVVVDGEWPTLDDCIPPGSILDVVDKYFFEFTDIPRELPFFTVLHYVTAMLMQQGVEIAPNKSQRVLPDLWTVVMAPSGAGKSQAQKAIAEAFGGHVTLFSEAKSSVKFADNLNKFRLGLYLRDEFAQFLKSVKKDKNMEDVTDYLLRTYDNADVTYESMKTKIVIKKSALSILGTTPTATITKYLTPEMMLDGFAQRFAFVVAEKDKSRERVPFYDFDDLPPAIQPLWAKLTKAPFHKLYYVDKLGMKVFKDAFNIVLDRADAEGVDESFSRRLMWRCFKYGLAYHVLTGKTDNTLHTEDLVFAARLVSISLRDLRKVMDLFEPTSSAKGMGKAAAFATTTGTTSATASDKLQKVTDYLVKLRDNNSAPVTASKLQGGIRALRGDAAETRALIDKAIANDPTLAPFIKALSSTISSPNPVTP